MAKIDFKVIGTVISIAAAALSVVGSICDGKARDAKIEEAVIKELDRRS